MKSENWGVEDAYGTCIAQGLTLTAARSRAAELNNLMQHLDPKHDLTRYYVVDYTVAETEKP